jgi:hypothetical protein
MNNSGDAAEQIVRLSLNGLEVVAKITGAGAKNIATFLYAVLKDQKRTKGKARMESMLRSGKELDLFSIKNEDLQKFAVEAKRYGILYCAVRHHKGSPDGLVDLMVRREDAVKINRIVERFKLATVDVASIKSEIQQTKDNKVSEKEEPEKDVPGKNDDEKLLDEMLGKPVQKEKAEPENPEASEDNPFFQKGRKSSPSEPTSESKSKSEKGTSDAIPRLDSDRTSVREELGEIKAARKQETDAPKRDDKQPPEKKKPQKSNQHQQPSKNRNKNKSKKTKER